MLATSRALLTLTLFFPLLVSGSLHAGEALSVDVFTAREFPVSGNDANRLAGATITVYAVDGLEAFESALSRDFPADAEAAKAEALRRIGQLDEAHLAPAKHAALGLAKALQSGVDRYPAIVLDGRTVVYGVTNLVEALERYDAWQRDHAP